MTNNDIAWLAGLTVTITPVVIYVILLMTADYNPIERRARRLAILVSVIVFVAIWTVTASIYSFVSELAGNFLMFPSIGFSAVAVWHVSRITYREMDGGKESQSSRSGMPQYGHDPVLDFSPGCLGTLS